MSRHIDRLTGLASRDTWEALLVEANIKQEVIMRSLPISIILIDLDDFKAVNDTYGHSEGDIVLGEIGHIILDIVPSNGAFRMGGDEFLCLLGNTPQNEAGELAKRIQSSIKSHRWVSRDTNEEYPVGASIGIVTNEDPNVSLEESFKLADSFMYESKKAGKGKISLAPKQSSKERRGVNP